jgi:hypothetical protein
MGQYASDYEVNWLGNVAKLRGWRVVTTRAGAIKEARRRAAMDSAATRGLRTGRDAALPAVHLRHWPCQVVHVPLPCYLSPACRAEFEGGAKKKARRFR